VQAGYDVLLFCLCGAIGQLFIFATIKRFGSLLNTLVTTTRKFFNILLSGEGFGVFTKCRGLARFVTA
jgi:UDP-galactose transporter B1